MRHLATFMTSWRNNYVTKINTPQGLGYALSWNGGMKNCMVQTIELDIDHLDKLEDKFESIVDKWKLYFSRVNHSYFSIPTFTESAGDSNHQNVDEGNNTAETTTPSKFTIGLQAHSNIGRIIQFHFDVEKNKVEPDKLSQQIVEWLITGQPVADMTYEPVMNPINDSTETSDISTSKNDFELRPIERDDDCGTENKSDRSYQFSNATSDEDLVVNSRNNIDDIRLYATPDPTKYNI